MSDNTEPIPETLPVTLFSYPYRVPADQPITVTAKDLIEPEAYEYCTPEELDTRLVFQPLYLHIFHTSEGLKTTLIDAWRSQPGGVKQIAGPTYEEWWIAPAGRFHEQINDKKIPPDAERTIRFPYPIWLDTREY